MSKIQLKDSRGNDLYPISTNDVVLTGLTMSTAYETDIIATSRNFILRETTESGVNYFYYSDDCGKTWTKNENTIGDITFVHFFSNGRVLLCGTQYCYTTTDFASFTRSAVYDYDGSDFTSISGAHSFYRLGWYNNEYHELGGKEVLVWNDYNTASSYVSRVWYTDDDGSTIRCILKDGVTRDTDGQLIDVRHFHRVWVEDSEGIIWVTSGDEGDECRLSKGTSSEGVWAWETIGTPGPLYKLSQIIIKRPFAYFVTDYTDGMYDTGLVVCPVASLDDTSAFRYLYKTDNKEALSKWFEDCNGNKVLFGDGLVYNVLWFARGNYAFTKIPVSFSTDTLAFGEIIGPNDLGQVVLFYYSSGGYNNAKNKVLTGREKILFSDLMHDAGISDFGNPQNIIRP